jgi:hypothetical protein
MTSEKLSPGPRSALSLATTPGSSLKAREGGGYQNVEGDLKSVWEKLTGGSVAL